MSVQCVCQCLPQEIAVLADELFGKRTCFDSVNKLEHIMRLCRSVGESMEWVAMTMADATLNRDRSMPDLTVSNLIGQQNGKQKGRLGQLLYFYFLSS